MFYQFQDTIKVIRRYEGWYYIQFYSYYIILYFKSDWSRIRPLPSTTLTICCHVHKGDLRGVNPIKLLTVEE